MKRILLVIVSTLVLLLISTTSASAFGLKDVIQMHRDGIADSLIIQKIEYSGKTFRLDADDMRDLKEAGVSDEVISTMLRTEDRRDDDRRDAYGYDDYYYPRTHLYLGFGGGYYPHGAYYDRYWYPRHYSYYSPRYYRPYYPRRHYYYRGGTGYRVPTGQWGTTRYRDRVGDRIYSGERRPAGYRERAGSAHPGTRVRTRTR